MLVAGLGIAFSQTTDHGVNQVLFSGQDALGPLVANPGAWSLSALALLIAFKGLAYGVSLGTFRGGPTFPAMFLGAAAGLMAAQLPGFELTPAVAVGMAQPSLRCCDCRWQPSSWPRFHGQAGVGSGPLVIVGVVVAYLTVQALPGPDGSAKSPQDGTGTAGKSEPAANASG